MTNLRVHSGSGLHKSKVMATSATHAFCAAGSSLSATAMHKDSRTEYMRDHATVESRTHAQNGGPLGRARQHQQRFPLRAFVKSGLASCGYRTAQESCFSLSRTRRRVLKTRSDDCKRRNCFGGLRHGRYQRSSHLVTCLDRYKKDPEVVSVSFTPESNMEKVKQNPLSGFFEGISNPYRADELGKEIAIIAFPALCALAADPLASLVDTAYIGRLGSVELAAVGVAISIFNLVSKMFNIPLLNITTSFVAGDGAGAKDSSPEVSASEVATQTEENIELLKPSEQYLPKTSKPLVPAVSSALVLGTALGVMEAVVLTLGAGPILSAMGVGATSSMRTPAVQYLALRAIGAPAVVVSLATQGVFRGFKDTKIPLLATVLSNVVNIILCPILMFVCNLGVSGAAVATVFSQYLMALFLLWILNSRVTLLPPKLGDLRFDRFLKSGGLLLGRTLAILSTMTLATSMAARLGAIPMAAHQISMQVWLAASLLSDSLALAGQAIIAAAFANKDYERVKVACFRIIQMGLGFGFFMALLLALGSPWFSKLFTEDARVLGIMAVILPFVVATQPINSLAFVFDGIYYGVNDFAFAAVSMVAVTIPSVIALFSLPSLTGISGVWIGLTLVMVLRSITGFLRISTSTGPWHAINEDFDEKLLGSISKIVKVKFSTDFVFRLKIPVAVPRKIRRDEEDLGILFESDL